METTSVTNAPHLLASRQLQPAARSRAVAEPKQGPGITRTPLTQFPAAQAVALKRVANVQSAPPTAPPAPVSHANPVQALFADWGKTDSAHDLDGSGKVGIGDYLQLLGTMSPDAPPQNDSPQDQVQALFDDWGKADSQWDLNSDGTVNVKDYLQLLGTMESGQSQDDASNPMQQRLESLLADWGKTDSSHDLDGDGTVGIRDFLRLLGKMGGTEPQVPNDTPDTGPDAQTPDAVDDAGRTPRSRLEALLADWGKEGSRFDLDGDGTVGIRDFLTMLGRMGQGREQDGPPANGAKRVPPGIVHRLRAAYDNAAAENIARSLLPQMGSIEPGELRQRLEDSNLPPGQRRAVLHRLASWHPQGHHVSLTG